MQQCYAYYSSIYFYSVYDTICTLYHMINPVLVKCYPFYPATHSSDICTEYSPPPPAEGGINHGRMEGRGGGGISSITTQTNSKGWGE